MVPDPFDPRESNRFAYIYNNPLRYTDPSRHCPWCVVLGKVLLQTAVDVGIDYLIARATGGEFHLARSLAVNAALNVTTLGVGSTVAKLRHLGKLATFASHADEAADAARVVAEAARHADEAADAVRVVGNASDTLRRIPLGFKNADDFAEFGARLQSGLKGAGYGDVQAFFRGSSVTGVSYTTGAPFDVGRVSDFDLALTSPKLFQRAKELGIGLRGGGTRTIPLEEEQLRALGLLELRNELQQLARRKVSFMIYRSTEDILKRGPAIPVP